LNCLAHPTKTAIYLQNSLDPGEAAVIQTAFDQSIETVCIDESAGRRVARLYGRKVTGSIGVLIRAKQKGMNISITESIDNMRTNGIWISDHLACMAVKLAEE
jgi:predicted nucleic acid-binding protein